jgi:hypothetical protein
MVSQIIKNLFLLIVVLLFIGELWAEPWIPTAQSTRKQTSITVDYGVAKNNYDTYFHISPNFSYRMNDEFGFSLSLPANALLYDKEPQQENSKTGKLRSYDYNESSDYFRVLNYFWYGQYEREAPGKITYSFYAGDIRDGRIGHGTIVNQYYNNIRFDTYNAGVLADFNTDYVGAQFFSNSLYSRDVNAVRLYIKPLAIGRKLYHFYQWYQENKNNEDEDEEEYVGMMQLRGNVLDEAGRKTVLEEIDTKKRKKKKQILPRQISKYSKVEIEEIDEWYNRMTIGITRAYDSNAPLEYSFGQTGIPNRKEKQDSPVITESGKISVEGYDFEYRILNMKYWEFTPYLDVNRIKELKNSGGTHYGFMARLGGRDINIIIKPELRKMSKNYLPMYFDSFYEVERFHGTLTSEQPMNSKFMEAKNMPTTGGISGYYHTFLLHLYSYSFEASYEKYQGEGNSRIFLASYIPLGSNLTLSFFYSKKGFDGTGQAFKIDSAAMGAGELSLPIGPVQIRLQNIRRWTFAENEPGFKSFDEQRLLLSTSFTL